jgi:hypothetical protein
MIQFRKFLNLSACALATAFLISACGGGAASAPEVAQPAPENPGVKLTAQTITFSPISAGTVGTPIILAGTATSALPLTYSSAPAAVCTVSGTNLTLLSVGTCAVKADQAGNSTYAAATPVSANIAVSAAVVPVVIDPNAINLETGGKGATFTWVAFDNGGAAAPTVVANPSATGINTSAKVLKFSLAPGAAWYTGMESKHGVSGAGSDLGTKVMSAANALVKMKVYKSLISDVGFKLVREDGASEGDVRVANTKTNAWEELSFNFCGKIAGITTIDQVVIFPDFNAVDVAHTNTSVSYVDDITFNACPPVVALAAPTTAPAAPTALAANVIALYSDAYTVVTGTDFPSFGSSTALTPEVIASNNVLKFSNFSYNGVTFPAQNLSTFNNLHIDVWSATATTIELKLVSLVPATKEQAIFKAVGAGVWTSIDVDLSLYTGPDKSKIEQMVLAANPSGGTVYVDNLYFSKTGTIVAATAPTTAPAAPTALAANVIALYSDAYTVVTGTDFPSFGSSTALTPEVIASNNVLKFSNFSYNGVTFPAQNLSTFNNLHIDVWSATATTIELKLVSLVPTTKEQAIFKAVGAGVWTSIDVDLSLYTGPDKSKIEQMVLAINPAGGTVYVDNLYFSK